MRVAAIDCGTNSIRLLIADVSKSADGSIELADVHREMRVVRLGQGVDATGLLAEEALERTFAAVKDYAQIIAELATSGQPVEKIQFVATSATRDAGNRQLFVDGIVSRLGVEPLVVSGSTEAALSFAGAASALPTNAQDSVLVVDLGGGSTEFVVGDSNGVKAALSTDMGCVRFTERYLKSDPPTLSEIDAAKSAILAKLGDVVEVVPLVEVTQVVGVAGTITTITAQALGLSEYASSSIHGASLGVSAVNDAAEALLRMNREQRSELGFMHPGRVDVIGAGALIWQTIINYVVEVTGGRIESVTSSEHDILDGIALNAAGMLD